MISYNTENPFSGGIFHDSCIHDFDLACWFAGEDPVSVVVMGHAFSNVIAKMDDVDSCSIMIKFPSGLIAMLDNTRGCCYGYEQQIEVNVGST